ncbi:MAG: hypothetical protein AABO58_02275 [Acidobacteriota bacterium]
MQRRVLTALLLAASCSLIAVYGFFFHRDNFSTHYPIKTVSAAAFRAGEIPYWNAFDGGGQPLAGNPNTLTFYPDNFLYLLLPAHVAFNLHFLIHLVLGWLAMRALTRSQFAAWMLVLSGIAISAMSFYSLITAIALVPFAFLAAERRSALQLGLAFGLMALAGEPVTIIATAIACAIIGLSRQLFLAIPIAVAIALPQIVSYAEIARETERGARHYSAMTALNASLEPKRLVELLVGPLLNPEALHLFPTLVLGVIIIPALFRRSRYTIVAAVMLFFALGGYNPVVRWAVESFESLRIARYPEKFALPMCVALIVLAADFHRRTRRRFEWTLITMLPLVAWASVTVPIDWWAPYDVGRVLQPVRRVFAPPPRGGQSVDRDDYRRRAHRLDPIFGAAAGIQYVLNRSTDGMHSLLSRVASERFAATRNPHWLQIAMMPDATVVPRAIGVRTIPDAVQTIESAAFDPRMNAVASERLDGYQSSASARIVRVAAGRDTIEVDVAGGPALLRVNASYFRAWVARIGDREIATFPLDLDRLGVVVPAGTSTVVLRFGRHRTLVVAAWVLSWIVLVSLALALRIKELDRRAGEVERPADEDRPLG